jgi:hypothetical protein
VIRHIGEGRFKTGMHLLCNAERLCNSQTDRRRSRTLQDTDSGVAEAAGNNRRRREGSQIEELRSRLACIKIGRYSIGTQNCSTVWGLRCLRDEAPENRLTESSIILAVDVYIRSALPIQS